MSWMTSGPLILFFSYLRRPLVDTVKIDQSLEREAPEHRKDASLAGARIATANSHDLSVVTEGVENIRQKNLFWQQGHLFSEPVTAG